MRGGARHTSQASQEAAARSDTFSLAVALTVGEEGESEPIRTDFDQATLQHEPYPYPIRSSPLTLIPNPIPNPTPNPTPSPTGDAALARSV